jgi:hypothetical protein
VVIPLALLACSGPAEKESPAGVDSGVDTAGAGTAVDTGSTDTAVDTGPPVGDDADGDGYGSVSTGGRDCDDVDPWTHPGAVEMCDDRDQDCDGDPLADGACAGDAHLGAVAERSWWLDPADGDPFPEFTLPDEDGDGTPEVMLRGGGLHVNGLVWLPGGTLTRSTDIADVWGAGFDAGSGDWIDDMKPAGDFDGDGWDDFWVTSSSCESFDNGRAYLIAGPAAGWNPDGATFEEAARDWWEEEPRGSCFGRTLTAGGDFDGDGRADAVVGGGDGAGGGPWVAYVLQASADSTGSQPLADAVAIAGHWVGLVVPDLDGDGTDDAIAYNYSNSATDKYISRWVSGSELVGSDGANLDDLGTLVETSPYNCVLQGAATSLAGDWNRDGHPDVACYGDGRTAIIDFPQEVPADFDIHDYVIAEISNDVVWALYQDEDGDDSQDFGMVQDEGDYYQYCLFPSSALAFGGVADFESGAACLATEMQESMYYWATFPFDADGDGDGDLLTYETEYPYDGMQHLWVWDLEGIPWGQERYW